MRMPQVRFDTIRMAGGWDEMTPILSLGNGVIRDSVNFESAVTGGYTRVKGYERYDGQPSPSVQVAVNVYIDSFVNVPAIGSTITGAVTGATGQVIAIGIDYVAVAKVTTGFNTSEQILVGSTVIGNAVPPTSTLTPKTSAINTALAADVYRADIQPVPGSGSALGGFLFNDIVYAFRNNSGGTAAELYKSSVSGWVNVPFYNEISFTAGGTGVPVDGNTLVQGSVTATIKRVVLSSGSWAGGDAAGRLIIDTPAGGNFASGAATANSISLTLSGVQTAITLDPNGKFESKIGNFSGAATTKRVYGCDGVNRAFEFDGDVLVPLTTGSSPDAPRHIAIHKNFLFMSIGSSLIFSAPGLPYDYTALSGAGEIATGFDITGLKEMPGNETNGTLMVTSRSVDGIHMLYGTSASNFIYTPYTEAGGGAIEYTIQNMAQTYMLDDRGVIGLQTTLNYGNFDSAAISYKVNNFITAYKNLAVCSITERLKSQYRVYFSNGLALYFTIVNGKLNGITKVQIEHVPYQMFDERFSDGSQGMFMCTTDGYVMQLEQGTSFDGSDINAFLTPNFDSSRSHRIRKRYRKCALEIFGGGYASISFGYSLGYGTNRISQEAAKSYVSDAIPAGIWDSFTWDNFIWDGIDLTPFELEMRGTAENVALTFKTGTNYTESFTINTATIHYSMRRAMR